MLSMQAWPLILTVYLSMHLSLQVLDTRDLDIQKVLDNSNGQELKFTLGTDGPAFAGQKLEVALPSSNEKR